MRDLHSKIEVRNALNSQAISTNTTTVGAIIDLQGFNSCELVAKAGAITDGAYALKVEHGDTDNLADAADVPALELLGAEENGGADVGFADTDDNAVKKVGYVGNKRYLRVSIVSTETSDGGNFTGLALLGDAHARPV